MNKQYRLKKDSPCDKAGCIFQWDNESGAYVGVLMSNSQYTADVVENNPEWFDPIVTTATIEIKAEMKFNSAWILFRAACTDLGIEIPDLVHVTDFPIELEKCWNAARMEDHFSRAVPRPDKYATFQDYMDRKPK